MNLKQLLGVELPIIQAPMAGAQGSALTIAVLNAGGLAGVAAADQCADRLRVGIDPGHFYSGRPAL